jgi:large subunit ribosomal protein L29
MLKIQDLRNKSEKELLQMVSELKGKLLALRFENATGQLQEIHLIKETKRDIARVFTALKEMQNGVVVEAKAPKAAPKAEVKEEATETEAKTYNFSKMKKDELLVFAQEKGVEVSTSMKKDEIIKAIEEAM